MIKVESSYRSSFPWLILCTECQLRPHRAACPHCPQIEGPAELALCCRHAGRRRESLRGEKAQIVYPFRCLMLSCPSCTAMLLTGTACYVLCGQRIQPQRDIRFRRYPPINNLEENERFCSFLSDRLQEQLSMRQYNLGRMLMQTVTVRS